jgi:hypothetical protein
VTRWAIHHGDALATLRTMPTASVDAIVTDPPAGIGFMNAAWDKDKGGRDAWIAWLAEVFTEARRVAKPGAHALVWALPRTSHWTATGLEDAGWELRDRVAHLFGTGFPKSHNLDGDHDGWGTALKPAVEDWHLARAPFSGTVAANVAAHGTGALHIDACRIGYASEDDKRLETRGVHVGGAYQHAAGDSFKKDVNVVAAVNHAGRWPAHLVLSHNEDCVPLGTAKVKAAPAWNDNRPPSTFTGAATSEVHHADGDGTETVERWECSAGCAVAMLDAQAGERESHGGGGANPGGGGFQNGAGGAYRPIAKGDSGGASRFFFCAKPSTAERELGLDGFTATTVDDGRKTTNDTAYLRDATQRRNIHPTVKSVALMRWLMRLITPPNGLVLDLFTGSGTTGIASMCEGFRFVGCEAEAPFAAIARARIAFAAANPRAFDPETAKPTKADPRQAELFGRTG